MKFSLRYLLFEIMLIAIFIGVCSYKPMWREHFYTYAAELTIVSTAFFVSLCAAVGGLFLCPGRGAIIGLFLSMILVPMVVIGSMF